MDSTSSIPPTKTGGQEIRAAQTLLASDVMGEYTLTTWKGSTLRAELLVAMEVKVTSRVVVEERSGASEVEW